MVVISHQPTSVLHLLEYDSSHNSIEANSDADEAPERACFVATPSRNNNGRETGRPKKRRSTNASARRVRILARAMVLRQQQEELDTLAQKLDRVYEDIERGCLEAVILKSVIMRIEMISTFCDLYLSSPVTNPNLKSTP